MKKQTKSLIIILIIWAVILFGIIISKELVIHTGTKLMLQAQPVDPRDVFRGDYVVLTYKNLSVIKQADLKYKYVSQSLEQWNNVYVLLDTEGKYPKPIGVYRTIASLKDKSQKGIFLRGYLTDKTNKELSIDYHIEHFFLPEGEGLKVERKTGADIAVEVIVNDEGSIVPLDLYVNDQKLRFKKSE